MPDLVKNQVTFTALPPDTFGSHVPWVKGACPHGLAKYGDSNHGIRRYSASWHLNGLDSGEVLTDSFLSFPVLGEHI